jgi:hypothetical protein
MTTNLTAVFLGLVLSLTATGCNNRSKATTERMSAAKGQTVAPTAPKATKVVFVGKEHPCDCTRKAIDAGWTALQKALGTPAKLPVERLQVDTEGARVEPYRSQKPIMALPAIYFVDSKDAVLDLLQGEVTAEQVASVLNGR